MCVYVFCVRMREVPKVITEECREPVPAAWGLVPFSVLSLFQTAHVEEHGCVRTDMGCVHVVLLCVLCMILPLCMAV